MPHLTKLAEDSRISPQATRFCESGKNGERRAKHRRALVPKREAIAFENGRAYRRLRLFHRDDVELMHTGPIHRRTRHHHSDGTEREALRTNGWGGRFWEAVMVRLGGEPV